MRPATPSLFGRAVRRIHCLGVGGMGMAHLAIYLAQSGFTVTGEDDAPAEGMAELLAREGVGVGSLPAECDLVVHSSAVGPGHPIFAAARARGLPLVRRGEALAEVLRERRLVAVCGSHGKTTTAAMLATILRQANFPAGYVLGGLGHDGGAPARVGSNDWVVAEIDESDGTIAGFSPEITVAVNLDWDHPDRYARLADLTATFAALFLRTRGAVLVSDACPQSLCASWAAGAERRRPSTPSDATGDFRGAFEEDGVDGLMLHLGGLFAAGEVPVRARGDFNAANATAALAAAQLMGVKLTPRALAGYAGVRRRQAPLPADGLTVIEDYAHHPAEIRALLPSLRRPGAPASRLVAVFQPHRHSRTAQFKAEFAAALALADRVHLLDVYAAGEAPVAGGTAADIYAEMKRGSPRSPSPTCRARTRISSAPSPATSSRATSWPSSARATSIARPAPGSRSLRSGRRSGRGPGTNLRRPVRPRLDPPAAKVLREEPLAPKTTLRVGGSARVYAEPAGEEDLRDPPARGGRGGRCRSWSSAAART